MDRDATNLGTGGIRKPQHQPTRKRHRAQSEESSEPIPKSRRLGKKLIKRRRSTEGEVQTQPSRTSPRLREIQNANQQRAKHTQKPARASLKRARTRRHIGSEESGPSPTSPKAQKNLKRCRNIKDGDTSNRGAKRLKSNDTAESNPRIDHSKDGFVEAWLSTSCSSRRTLVDGENELGELDLVAADDMSFPSVDGSGASVSFASSSKKSDKSSASVHDTDYRESLGYRNIYIFTLRSRSSPEMDETAAQVLKNKPRELQTRAEDILIPELASRLISAMTELPDQRLALNVNQPWFNAVPVLLDSSIVTDPLPLPRPKPDRAFGYSKKAFTRKQLATIDLLTDPLRRSYAKPDKELLFPFIDMEFKSQAKGGTHYIATNQAATAGAVASNGFVELTRRGLGLKSLDYDEPQFFSLSMDHEYIRINVHWLSVDAEDGQFRFYVEGLTQQFLKDADGLRVVQRAVKNILDWGRNEQLPKIRKQLDAYEKRRQIEKAAAAASESASVETKPRNGQKQDGRKRKSTVITVTAPIVQDKLVTKRAPPLILQSARALSDFIPDPEDEQSVFRFIEGETIEFVNAKAVEENGWLRGRIKGGDGRWGCVPAEYLEL